MRERFGAVQVSPVYRTAAIGFDGLEQFVQSGFQDIPGKVIFVGSHDHRMGRYRDVVANQQFLIELFTGTQSSEFYGNITLRITLGTNAQTGQMNHFLGQFHDPAPAHATGGNARMHVADGAVGQAGKLGKQRVGANRIAEELRFHALPELLVDQHADATALLQLAGHGEVRQAGNALAAKRQEDAHLHAVADHAGGQRGRGGVVVISQGPALQPAGGRIAVVQALVAGQVGRLHRPAMALENVIRLEITNVGACVKIDDTPVGIEEGRNAGMWTVGLLLSGNAAGLTELEFLALDEESRQTLRDRAAATFAHAQPHYLIDTVAQLPAVIEQITERMAQGECPADSL